MGTVYYKFLVLSTHFYNFLVFSTIYLDKSAAFMEHNKIFERMAKQGKTGKELANYLKVTQQTVTNWKIGVSESYKKRLPEIAVFLNTTVEELTGITLPAEDTLFLSRHEIALIQAYRANEKMQEAVDTLLGIGQAEDTPIHQQRNSTSPPILGRTGASPRIAAYGAGSISLDTTNAYDDPEIDRILRKIKKPKK